MALVLVAGRQARELSVQGEEVGGFYRFQDQGQFVHEIVSRDVHL